MKHILAKIPSQKLFRVIDPSLNNILRLISYYYDETMDIVTAHYLLRYSNWDINSIKTQDVVIVAGENINRHLRFDFLPTTINTLTFKDTNLKSYFISVHNMHIEELILDNISFDKLQLIGKNFTISKLIIKNMTFTTDSNFAVSIREYVECAENTLYFVNCQFVDFKHKGRYIWLKKYVDLGKIKIT